MRRFLCKCLLLTFIVSGVLVVAGQAYKQTTTYRNLEIIEDTGKYQYLPETVDFAVFGTSHGQKAFPFCLEQKNAFNFAMSSQTPAYDWMVMREFQDRFRSGTIVALCIDYFSLYFKETPNEFEQKQQRYYRILSPCNIIDVDVSHWILQKISPVLTTSAQSVSAAFLKPPALRDDNADKQISLDDLESEQARILRNHVGIIERCFPEVDSAMWEAYHHMLDLCRDRGWAAVLVTPPLLSDYNECFPSGFYAEFCKRMEALAAEYDVPWLDYSHDSEFNNSYVYFWDIDHLNMQGARIFNQIFWNDLENLGIMRR